MLYLSISTGEYHQYDHVVYPRLVKEVPKTFLETGKEYLSFILPISRTKRQEEADIMAKKCLNFYLEPYKDQLLQDREYSQHYKVDDLIDQVVRVYKSHRVTLVKHNKPLYIPNECIENVSFYI